MSVADDLARNCVQIVTALKYALSPFLNQNEREILELWKIFLRTADMSNSAIDQCEENASQLARKGNMSEDHARLLKHLVMFSSLEHARFYSNKPHELYLANALSEGLNTSLVFGLEMNKERIAAVILKVTEPV